MRESLRAAAAAHEIHDFIRERWSPRAFGPESIPDESLRSLFEAARWAPSAMNEQPWRFLVARREEPEEFERLLSCLVPGNQRWAGAATALVVTAVAGSYARTGAAYAHAWHDLGLAVGQLSAEATARGIRVHQMAGIDRERTRELLSIPDGFEPVTAIALGYPGDPNTLEDDLKSRELAPRGRRPQSEFVFGAGWERPLSFPGEAEFEEVLVFWFGDEGRPGGSGFGAPDVAARWWKKDPGFDAQVRERFGGLYERVRRGERPAWLASARGRLAAVIVLDQFPRNMFRGDARSFESDALALQYALEGIDRGMDRALSGDLRAFFYLPLMHAEELAIQDRCVELFAQFRDELEEPARSRIANNHEFAVRHRDIIARWERFPHRNEILGRASTDAERAFLQEPNSSF